MSRFSEELSKNFTDQPFPRKRDIVSDFRCFHPSHTSSDRKLRGCESATRNDVEPNISPCLWVSMAIKKMNLAKLPVWIIVVIQIFHFGAGKCGEELLVVSSSIRLQVS